MGLAYFKTSTTNGPRTRTKDARGTQTYCKLYANPAFASIKTSQVHPNVPVLRETLMMSAAPTMRIQAKIFGRLAVSSV
jgi:hypothetical protein